MSDRKKFIYGFDYLRIILCVGVIALHSNIFTIQNQYTGFPNPLYYKIILYNYFWVCVPCFLMLSLFLYVRNSYNNRSYFKKRLKQLLIVYLFWAFIELILNRYGNISFIFQLNINELILLFMSNYTIVYFLFNLLVFTVITEFIIRIYKKYNCNYFYIIIFILTLVVMFISIYFNTLIFKSSEFPYLLGFSDLLLFLPYPFCALFLYHFFEKNSNEIIKKYCIIFALVWLLLAIVDYYLRYMRFDFLKYNYESLGRPALIFESLFLISVFYLINKKTSNFIKEVSNLTMGVFLIHTIVLNYLGVNTNSLGIYLNGFQIFIITTLLSFTITWIIKKVKGLI